MAEQGGGSLLVVGAGEEGMHSILLNISCTQSADTLVPRAAAASKTSYTSLKGEHIMQLTEKMGGQVTWKAAESGPAPGCWPVYIRLRKLCPYWKQSTRGEDGGGRVGDLVKQQHIVPVFNLHRTDVET